MKLNSKIQTLRNVQYSSWNLPFLCQWIISFHAKNIRMLKLFLYLRGNRCCVRFLYIRKKVSSSLLDIFYRFKPLMFLLLYIINVTMQKQKYWIDHRKVFFGIQSLSNWVWRKMAHNFKSFDFFTRHRSIEIMMMIGNRLNGFNFVSTDVCKY